MAWQAEAELVLVSERCRSVFPTTFDLLRERMVEAERSRLVQEGQGQSNVRPRGVRRHCTPKLEEEWRRGCLSTCIGGFDDGGGSGESGAMEGGIDYPGA